ncbi:hypothetical protein [Sporolactobacillus laevolacticus]|nr:hypothetical protein [Sporolactobacillus laevolacticus]
MPSQWLKWIIFQIRFTYHACCPLIADVAMLAISVTSIDGFISVR